MWVRLDLLIIAESRRKRMGRYPSGAELMQWLNSIGYRFCGDDLFASDFDATDALPDNSILEFINLPCRSHS